MIASPHSFTGRRTLLVVSLGLALLPLAGCKRAPAGRYQKDGLSFEHLAGWSVAKDTQKTARHISVEGPGHALLTIAVFAPHLDVSLETFVKTVTKGRSAEVKKTLTVGGVNIGSEASSDEPVPIKRTIAGTVATGFEEHFTLQMINIPVPHTTQYFLFTIGDRPLIVMAQVSDENRPTAIPGFQKIFDTIALAPAP